MKHGLFYVLCILLSASGVWLAAADEKDAKTLPDTKTKEKAKEEESENKDIQSKFEMQGNISVVRTALIEEMLRLVADMTAVLKEVKDTSSADEAAGKVYDLNLRVRAVCKKSVESPFLTMDEVKAVQKKYGRQVDAAYRSMEDEAKRIISHNFYDSNSLIYAMTAVSAHTHFTRQDNALSRESGNSLRHRGDLEDIISKEFIEKTGRQPIQRREFDYVYEHERIIDIKDNELSLKRIYGYRMQFMPQEPTEVSSQKQKKKKK